MRSTSVAASRNGGGRSRSIAVSSRGAAILSSRPAGGNALSPGSRGPAVVFVQERLGIAPATGYYGPVTRTAVRTLQEYQAGVDRSSAADHRADEPGAASDQRG